MAKKLPAIPAQLPDGRRHINLKKDEREALAHQKQIEHAVSLFLDLEQDRTVAQIAAEMGIDTQVLKRLTNDAAFQTIYDAALMGLGHHPRLQSVQAQLPDLLPLAYRKLQQLMTRPGVADTAAVAAIKLLFETTNLKDMIVQEDPMQLANFLKSRGVDVGGDLVVNFNLPIPDEYREAFHRMMRPDSHITEGVVNTVDSAAPQIEGASSSPTPVDLPSVEEVPPDALPS